MKNASREGRSLRGIDITYEYLPMPNHETGAIACPDSVRRDYSQSEVRYKRYEPNARVPSLRAEMERLNVTGFTHVANIPGVKKHVLRYAAIFRMIVVDRDDAREVADSWDA